MVWKKDYTDAQIIEAILTGGKGAEKVIAHLYRKYREDLVQYIISRNGSKNEALDIFQDTIVTLVVSIEQGKFQGKSTIKTYLYSIGKRLWYRRFHKNVRDENYRNDQNVNQLEEHDPESLLLTKDQQAVVERTLGQLKPKSREVLELWIQNYSMREIAEIMGFKNEQVARNKKSLSLKELKALLANSKQSATYIDELR
ncbi:MAG: sigma-70 family RNA polymerase sigma factor [Bacteroidota bacterium]